MNSVDADLEAVRERLREAAKGPSGSALPLLEDLASRPGKLLRPRLLCLFARACARAGQKEGRSPPDGRPEAVLTRRAVELLHLHPGPDTSSTIARKGQASFALVSSLAVGALLLAGRFPW
jgi:geranylgeranyl pyrophosphate synthase